MKPKWTHEKFLNAWGRATCLAQVATTLGITPRYASQIAHRFRKNGVKLKRMPTGRPPSVNWKKLRKRT